MRRFLLIPKRQPEANISSIESVLGDDYSKTVKTGILQVDSSTRKTTVLNNVRMGVEMCA